MKLYSWISIISFLLLLSACGPAAMYPRDLTESEHLKEYAQSKNIASPSIKKADSLKQAATLAYKEEKVKEAQWNALYAKLYYKQGILKAETENATNKMSSHQSLYEKEKEHLSGLLEVLKEINSMRKP